jgi:hypothetical protein
LSIANIGAILFALMRAPRKNDLPKVISLVLIQVSLVSCIGLTGAHIPSNSRLVELVPFELDRKNPERKQFGSLTFMSAYQLESKDKRFGGLSGLSFGPDGKLYAISDHGFWISAKIITNPSGALVDLMDWQIAPMLTTANTPVTEALRDAEALALAQDGSFLVAFEGVHRIWRYDPLPATFESTPLPVAIPADVTRAPSNGGLEGLTVLPDGRLLALTEEFANPDGSFKGWLIDNGQFAELSYVPSKDFRVTDCAVLDNGDVLVLERRYVPFDIWSARLALVDAKSIQPGSKLRGRELLRLEQPLAVDNFEGVAVQQTSKGTMIYIVSDDNYNPFQQTLLIQFLLPNREN